MEESRGFLEQNLVGLDVNVSGLGYCQCVLPVQLRTLRWECLIDGTGRCGELTFSVAPSSLISTRLVVDCHFRDSTVAPAFPPQILEYHIDSAESAA